MRSLHLPQASAGEVAAESNVIVHRFLAKALHRVRPGHAYLMLRDSDEGKFPPADDLTPFYEEDWRVTKRKDRIKSVEDLHATVNSLFAQYGSTLESNFVVFTFLGQTHLMVRCSPETFGPIRHLAEHAAADGTKLDAELARLVGQFVKGLAAYDDEPEGRH